MNHINTPSWKTRLLASMAAVALAGCTTAQPAPQATSQPVAQSATQPTIQAAPVVAQPQAALPNVAQVADRVRPATVLVVNLVAGRQTNLPGASTGEVPQGTGTGFIIDGSGLLVTNNHVIEGAQRLRVILPPPDNRGFDAELVGADPQTDLAVLRIQGDRLPTVPLGSSSALKPGEWVVAVGNALGLPGGPTVTAGVVSALGREVQEPEGGPTLYDLVQTDTAINPGNSGGPLVNLNGEVIGINTLGSTDAQNINFAISIDSARTIIDQLRQNGRVARGYMGVGATTLTSAIAAQVNVNRSTGVVLATVAAGGPASGAGLRQGDVIIALNDVTIDNLRGLQTALTERFRPNDTVTVRYIRGGAEQTAQVRLAERPQS